MSDNRDATLAAFHWTIDDFIAFSRGLRMLGNQSYGNWLLRFFYLFMGHLFLLTGLFIGLSGLLGKTGSTRPIPPEATVINLAIAAIAGYCLYTMWYGWRRTMNRWFQRSGTSGESCAYRFSPAGVEITERLVESRRDWSLVTVLAEFRDAFLLSSQGLFYWIPVRAFRDSTEVERFRTLARQAVKGYRVIKRDTYITIEGRPFRAHRGGKDTRS